MDPKQKVHDWPIIHTMKKNDSTAGYASLLRGASMKETTTNAVPINENQPTILKKRLKIKIAT